jgi:hypothetical protein
MYERRVLMAPESLLSPAAIVICQLEPPARDIHHCGHSHLADPHLVHNLNISDWLVFVFNINVKLGKKNKIFTKFLRFERNSSFRLRDTPTVHALTKNP